MIGHNELQLMEKMTVTIFEILERAWAALDCSLIDMKIEFGVKDGTGMNIVLVGHPFIILLLFSYEMFYSKKQ